MILFVEQELTHYRIPVFKRLEELVDERLVVVHGPPHPDSYLNTVDPDDDLPFEHIRVSGLWMGEFLGLHNIIPVVTRYKPDTVILRGAVRVISMYALIAVYKCKGIPLVLWGEGFSSRRRFDPGDNVLDNIHLAVVRSADAYVCYTEDVRAELANYISSERLFVANNTVDVGKELEIYRELSNIGRRAIRQELGLYRDIYLVFIGRLQKRKIIGDILEAVAVLRDVHNLKVGLLVIGAGPEREKLERKTSKLELRNQVSFLGEKYGREAGKYLYISDAMVMPGAVGLAANHAFAFGLPVIAYGSSDEHRAEFEHGPEAAHVVHGYTGWWAKPDTPEQLAIGVRNILAKRHRYRKTVLKYAEQDLALDRMVEGFVEAVKYARTRSES